MNIHKLYECIKSKNANNSYAREAIYDVLEKSDNCLSVVDITKRLHECYPRKISLNTIYRHLTLFSECGLVVMIQDDVKKSYYILTGNKAQLFTLCPQCNSVSIIKDINHNIDLLNSMESREFITVHKRCEHCKLLNL